MIAPGSGIVMRNVFDSLDYFAGIAKKIPTDRLMGFVDGLQETSFKGRFHSDSTLIWPMADELKYRAGKIETINPTNYFGAYLNGYLCNAGVVSRLFDMMGKNSTKYSCAVSHLDIPNETIKDKGKDCVYNALEDRKLLIYDDRGVDWEGNRKYFEPRFRL